MREENVYSRAFSCGWFATQGRPVTRAIIWIIVLALLMAANLSMHTSRAQAATYTHLAKGTLVSTPVAGPTQAIIAVSGSGWQSVPDETVVNFGYSASSSCGAASYIPAATEQAGVVSGGAFSGWFLWPAKTPVGMYTVCASIGSTLAVAGSYTVLSVAPARLTISSPTFNVGQQATVSGSNFLPPQTKITLTLQQLSGGTSIPLGTATSDANGAFSQTYTIPASPTGPVELIASTGSGTPPTLSASVTFIVYAAPVTPTPTITPSPAPSPTPVPGKTATPTPGKTATPTSIPTQSTQATPTPATTATPISLGTQPQTPTPTSSTKSTQLSTGQMPGTGSQQSKETMALIAGAAFMLLAASLVVLSWRRKAKKRASPLHPAIPGTNAFTHTPSWQSPPVAQPAQAGWIAGAGWGDLAVQQAPPALSVTQPDAHGNVNNMAIGSPFSANSAGEIPGMPYRNGGNEAESEPPVPAMPAPVPSPASSDLLQDPLLAAIMRQARGGLFVLPGKKP